jgi:hypothetical protein
MTMRQCSSRLFCVYDVSCNTPSKVWHLHLSQLVEWLTCRRQLSAQRYIDVNTEAWSANADVIALKTRTLALAMQATKTNVLLCGQPPASQLAGCSAALMTSAHGCP